MPIAIISDRDRIFTRKVYQALFKALNVEVRLSTGHQIYGQTERVNQCVEAYLRNMVFQNPKSWMKWLSLSEYWYNTSYHTSSKVSPFQALYGYLPPMIGELAIPDYIVPEALSTLTDITEMMKSLKENLVQAHNRMNHFANMHRLEWSFEVGDMAYLKIQLYRQNVFGL